MIVFGHPNPTQQQRLGSCSFFSPKKKALLLPKVTNAAMDKSMGAWYNDCYYCYIVTVLITVKVYTQSSAAVAMVCAMVWGCAFRREY